MSDGASDKSKPSAIDLGLSAFVASLQLPAETLYGAGNGSAVRDPALPALTISSAPITAPAQSSTLETVGAVAPAADPSSADSYVADGEFKRFAAAARWQELAAYCEKKLAASSELDVEAKLWWVKAQLATEAIPDTILAAPLEGAARELQTGRFATAEGLRDLCCQLLKEVVARLKPADAVISATLTEQITALGFAPSKLQREPASSVELDAARRIRELQLAAGQIAQSSAVSSSTARVSTQAVPAGGGAAASDSGPVAKQTVRVIPQSAQRVAPRLLRSRRAVAAAVVLLLIAGSSLLWFNGTRGGLVRDLVAPVDIALADLTPELEVRSLQPIAALSRLDAVYYDLEQGGTVGSGDSPVTNPQLTLTSVGAVLDSEKSAAQRERLERSRSPVGADRGAVGPRSAEKSTERSRTTVEVRIPGAAPATDAAVNVERPRNRMRREVVDTSGPIERGDMPALEPEPEDDIYALDFPPYRRNESPARNDQSRGRGNAGDFTGPAEQRRLYVIIARTKVLNEPSYWAQSNEDLKIGDRIEVEDNLGKWLRVRSQGGRTGYVLAQDAELAAR